MRRGDEVSAARPGGEERGRRTHLDDVLGLLARGRPRAEDGRGLPMPDELLLLPRHVLKLVDLLRQDLRLVGVELVDEVLDRAGDGEVGEGGRARGSARAGRRRSHALAAVGGRLLDVDERNDVVDERGAREGEEGVERSWHSGRVLQAGRGPSVSMPRRRRGETLLCVASREERGDEREAVDARCRARSCRRTRSR